MLRQADRRGPHPLDDAGEALISLRHPPCISPRPLGVPIIFVIGFIVFSLGVWAWRKSQPRWIVVLPKPHNIIDAEPLPLEVFPTTVFAYNVKPGKDMTWNYRIIKKTEQGQEYFAIHEAYYEGEQPTSITKNPCWPSGETISELSSDLSRMLEAFKKPVLNDEDFHPKSAADQPL